MVGVKVEDLEVVEFCFVMKLKVEENFDVGRLWCDDWVVLFLMLMKWD